MICVASSQCRFACFRREEIAHSSPPLADTCLPSLSEAQPAPLFAYSQQNVTAHWPPPLDGSFGPAFPAAASESPSAQSELGAFSLSPPALRDPDHPTPSLSLSAYSQHGITSPPLLALFSHLIPSSHAPYFSSSPLFQHKLLWMLLPLFRDLTALAFSLLPPSGHGPGFHSFPDALTLVLLTACLWQKPRSPRCPLHCLILVPYWSHSFGQCSAYPLHPPHRRLDECCSC
mmetsp:Transcript_100743/g.174036  ORF Transcript_100743/g.174036 Transcript_100743/m.174036 type:complete len:231 (-) Transcript_100743:597-1289(-)